MCSQEGTFSPDLPCFKVDGQRVEDQSCATILQFAQHGKMCIIITPFLRPYYSLSFGCVVGNEGRVEKKES